jgi:hypothetical protein
MRGRAGSAREAAADCVVLTELKRERSVRTVQASPTCGRALLASVGCGLRRSRRVEKLCMRSLVLAHHVRSLTHTVASDENA